MQRIAHLPTPSAKTVIAERPTLRMRVDPKTEDALLGSPELAGARNHTAAIDPYWKSVRCAVLESQNLRRQLGRAIKRHRRRGRKFLSHAQRGNARRAGLRRSEERRVGKECTTLWAP